MIIGKSDITQYFDGLQKPYFAIFNKGKVETANTIYRNDKADDLMFEDARTDFDRILKLLGHGEYTLIVSDKKDVTARGGNRIDFKVLIADTSTPQPAVAGISSIGGIGAITMDQVEKMADERFQKLMDKQKLTDTLAKNVELEKEVKALQASNGEPINKLLKALEPHTPAIISGLFPNAGQQAAVNLSGVKPDATGTGTDQAQKLFEDFGVALVKARPNDWEHILVKLTNLVNDEQKLNMALTFL